MDIHYRPELNWNTYQKVLDLAQMLRGELQKTGRPELVPSDMIDIQSFIWIIDPGY